MILLLGASLCVGIIFLIAFIWSVRSGQFDDDYSPAHKILFENTTQPKNNASDSDSNINKLHNTKKDSGK